MSVPTSYAAPDWSRAEPRDYFRLLKPRVMSLVVFTGLVGYLLAPGSHHPLLGGIAIFALALGAGSAGAMNMVYERARDALMERTRTRPLPSGLMHPSDAWAFAVISATLALLLMWLAAGVLATLLLGVSIFYYAVIYTIWLKPRTPQNIVIGGAAGAFPPMIGWAAAGGGLTWDSLILFAIIFFWTPPHFWALALFRRDDYAAADFPMLPNIAGIAATKRHILAYTLLLLPLGSMPYILGTVGEFYAIIALGLGLVFISKAWRLWRSEDIEGAHGLFGFSILYLFALFGALLLDRALFFLWSLAG